MPCGSVRYSDSTRASPMYEPGRFDDQHPAALGITVDQFDTSQNHLPFFLCAYAILLQRDAPGDPLGRPRALLCSLDCSTQAESLFPHQSPPRLHVPCGQLLEPILTFEPRRRGAHDTHVLHTLLRLRPNHLSSLRRNV
jgi:hypothetical protein